MDDRGAVYSCLVCFRGTRQPGDWGVESYLVVSDAGSPGKAGRVVGQKMEHRGQSQLKVIKNTV